MVAAFVAGDLSGAEHWKEDYVNVRNWDRFQHFKPFTKGRSKPPWIKLYREILDDSEWHALDGDAAKLLIMIFLLASEDNGKVTGDKKKLAFRFRVSESFINKHIASLGHWLCQDDITMISPRYQDDPQDKDKEEDKDKDKENKEKLAGKPAAHRPAKIQFAPRVYLTEQEHAILTEKYGTEATAWMIEKLDAWKEGKGLNGKFRGSDAGKIRSWVVNAWQEWAIKSKQPGAKPAVSDSQRDKYSYLEEK